MNEQCLGIYWGTKRIGLALGNAETKLASPIGMTDSLAGVLEWVKKEKIERLVVGVPFHASSEERKLNNDFMAFLEALEVQSGLPLSQVDERFTSQAADTLGATSKRDGGRDAIAAMIILQSYFDSL
jgi:putative Holliday junction resolvase